MRKRFGQRAGSLSGAVALVVSGMALPAYAANLLENPGFESPTSNTNPNNTITDWSQYGGVARGNYYNHTPSGQWSAWEEVFQGDGESDGGQQGGVYQNVSNITAGTPYTLTAWQYFEPNFIYSQAICDLELTWFGPGTIGGNAAQIGNPAETLINSATVTTGQWIQYSVSNARAPTGSTQVEVSFDWANGEDIGGQQSAFVDDADLEGAGIPPNAMQWTVNGDGEWNAMGNWDIGVIPNGAGVEADLFSASTSPASIITNTAVTLGKLHFNNSSEYEITGLGSLTLQATGSGTATVQVDQGTDELNLPLTIASNTIFNVATNANLIVANPVTIDSGKTLTQTGSGKVIYESTVTTQSSAQVLFENSTHINSLSLATGSTATVAATTLEVDNLSNLGTINLENNALIINYGSGMDPLSSIVKEVISGYNSGSWTGAGITSSNARSNSSYGIGYADSATPGNPANISSGQIELVYTLLGDANLDGKVNGADFTLLATNFNDAVTNGWSEGDFNYDGKVNGDDFVLMAENFNQFASQTSVSDTDALDAFAANNDISLSNVPEPASFFLLAVGLIGNLAHRRRKLLQ